MSDLEREYLRIQEELEETNRGVVALYAELEEKQNALSLAQAEAVASRDRWQAVFEMMQDGTVLVNEGGLILQHNDAAQSLFRSPSVGLSLYTALRSPWTDHLESIKALRNDFLTSTGEFRVDSRCYRVVYRCLKKSSASLACGVFIFNDVTEKQDIIDAVTQKSLFKSEFLANMSHEIRTPMTGLLGWLELLNKTKLNDAQRNYVSCISDCSESLLRLVNDLIDLSRVEAGAISFKDEIYSVNALVQSAKSVLLSKAGEKNLEFRVAVAHDVPDLQVGDKGRLSQILINLLSNAVKFTDNGSVALSVEALETDHGTRDIRYSVKDTGRGISKVLQAKLFEKYSQETWSFENRHQGAGLGLSIVQQLLERQGGRLEVSSEPGIGSIFSFTLPAREVAQEQQLASRALRPDKPKSGRKGRILIVEDNPMVRKVMTAQIEAIGYQVESTDRGKEALEILNSRDFQLVTLDYHLSDISGLEVARAIKVRDQGPFIVAITGRTDEQTRMDCLSSGMRAVLIKPVSGKDLEEMLDRYALID